jgi:magnesium-transporting ATPase (P-type)
VVAADVRLTGGEVLLDQSMLTGESVPIEADAGVQTWVLTTCAVRPNLVCSPVAVISATASPRLTSAPAYESACPLTCSQCPSSRMVTP